MTRIGDAQKRSPASAEKPGFGNRRGARFQRARHGHVGNVPHEMHYFFFVPKLTNSTPFLSGTEYPPLGDRCFFTVSTSGSLVKSI